MNLKYSLLLATILLFTACKPEAPENDTAKNSQQIPVYTIGYMICNSEKETLDRFQPMSVWLGKKLGVRFETRAIDTIDFTREVDKLDFVHTNSLLYIMLHRFNGVEVLAAERKGSLGYKSQGIILALKKSGITSVKDLAGKSMIFGPTLAPTGFMSQVDVLQQAGIDLERDLSRYSIPKGSWKHEKVIYGVLFEKYDAGAIPLDDLESMAAEGRIDQEDFTIVAKGPEIPYCNFGVTQKTDEKLAKRFQEAVLSLKPTDTTEIDGESVRVLNRAKVDGYEEIKDADFDVIREMAKRTNMPPYQKY